MMRIQLRLLISLVSIAHVHAYTLISSKCGGHPLYKLRKLRNLALLYIWIDEETIEMSCIYAY
jgi:hypothetical protein